MKVIAICGASGSGKTTLASRIKDGYSGAVEIISMDDYYFPNLSKEHNFDLPESLDIDLLDYDLSIISAGEPLCLPRYDFVTKVRSAGRTIRCKPDLLVVEGMFSLYSKFLLNFADLKVFCDCDIDLAIRRRVYRDEISRERLGESDDDSNFDNVVSGYYRYVVPQKNLVNLVICTNEYDRAEAKILEAL